MLQIFSNCSTPDLLYTAALTTTTFITAAPKYTVHFSDFLVIKLLRTCYPISKESLLRPWLSRNSGNNRSETVSQRVLLNVLIVKSPIKFF